jgi:hypothetical protein
MILPAFLAHSYWYSTNAFASCCSRRLLVNNCKWGSLGCKRIYMHDTTQEIADTIDTRKDIRWRAYCPFTTVDSVFRDQPFPTPSSSVFIYSPGDLTWRSLGENLTCLLFTCEFTTSRCWPESCLQFALL